MILCLVVSRVVLQLQDMWILTMLVIWMTEDLQQGMFLLLEMGLFVASLYSISCGNVNN